MAGPEAGYIQQRNDLIDLQAGSGSLRRDGHWLDDALQLSPDHLRWTCPSVRATTEVLPRHGRCSIKVWIPYLQSSCMAVAA
ncbi:MAG: hypothetical protein KGL61_08735 [Burkholderiales bacterium]|nr:hypothetical protein [Burkholderiales bacterium]